MLIKNKKIIFIIGFLLIFLIVKTLVNFKILSSNMYTQIVEYSCFFSFLFILVQLFFEKSKISDKIEEDINDFENFVYESVIVSRTDKKGRITYVNKKFEQISGYKFEEVIGKDHNIVNSGKHPKKMWTNMYKTITKERKIWNGVITNRSKEGNLYYVDTYIKALFDEKTNKLKGFISIRQDVTDIVNSFNEIDKKNVYLEHAAKILRHDMHSGINTYIPRGISSLERRLNSDMIEELKIEPPLKMIKEGLKHTQKVYKGVYEFTNLVKSDAVLNKSEHKLDEILKNYLQSTAYSSQVEISQLIKVEVNEPLFCTAIDNLIRNGLKYNDSDSKIVKIFIEDNTLVIQDNGRGMTHEEFERFSEPYVRRDNQKESGSGLGLNICIAIIKEHGFSINCEKNEIGTKIKIKL